MPSILHHLSRTALEELARALTSNRIQPPYTGFDLHPWLNSELQPQVAAEFERLRFAGMTSAQIAIVIDFLAFERARQQRDTDKIEMVWTGPDQEGPSTRDTGVVAREMIAKATRSLLITTLSISTTSTTFQHVFNAMDRNGKLDVTVVLNVERPKDAPSNQQTLAAFSAMFWTKQWPWQLKPHVFYDPRSVAPAATRALQHAKCIVADQRHLLITSSNYTESGQLRNIELGVAIDDGPLASRVVGQFRSLVAKNLLMPLPL